MLHTTKLLGVTITNETEEKVLEYVCSSVSKSSEKLFITTPNPEILVYASSHLDYKDKLNSSDVSLPDGSGLLIGGWIMAKPLKGRITGVDFIEKLCLASREKPMSMGFLGGRGGVAERAAERLKKKYPWIKVAWVGEELDEQTVSSWQLAVSSKKKEESPSANRQVPTADIDILFVAFGFPKQEEWIYEHLSELPVKAAMGVGGAFDYLSGDVMRAPKLVRLIGMEWLFRLIRQPWRWRRQLALTTFLFLILKERLQPQKAS